MSKTERHFVNSEWFEELIADTGNEKRIIEKRAIALKIAQKINQALSSLANRLDAMEKPAAEITGRVESFAVQGRQGLFHLTWIRVLNVDGYIIEMFTDSAATVQIGSWIVWGANSVQWQVPVGNVAVTRYFRITPFVNRASGGLKLGTPSSVVSGLSVGYGAGEAAPTSPTVAPSPYTESRGLSARSVELV